MEPDIEELIRIGKELRDVLDEDVFCPVCHSGTSHKAWCVAQRWDSALLTVKSNYALARLQASNTACSRTPTVADLDDKNNLVGVG